MKSSRNNAGALFTHMEQLEPRKLFNAGWTPIASPNASSAGNSLQAVAAVSPTDVWAVGGTDEVSGTQGNTLIEHFNGSGWSVVPSPNPGHNSINSGNVLSGVTALASNNVWAVGYYWQDSLFRTLIEHWNGSSWSVVSSPNPAPNGYNVLYGISAVSANDIWAVGYLDGENQFGVLPLIEHWNGSAWSVVPSPNQSTGNVLESVSALNSQDVWATGTFYDPTHEFWKTLTEHWDGSAWRIFDSPSPGNYLGNNLSSVTAVASNDVWAVGSYDANTGATETLIEHWNGRKWSEIESPNLDTAYGSENVLTGVTKISGNNLWAVGYASLHTETNHHALSVHWNGSAWSLVSTPSPAPAVELYGVATASGRLWAVGAFSQFGNQYGGGLIVPETFVMTLGSTTSSKFDRDDLLDLADL